MTLLGIALGDPVMGISVRELVNRCCHGHVPEAETGPERYRTLSLVIEPEGWRGVSCEPLYPASSVTRPVCLSVTYPLDEHLPVSRAPAPDTQTHSPSS